MLKIINLFFFLSTLAAWAGPSEKFHAMTKRVLKSARECLKQIPESSQCLLSRHSALKTDGFNLSQCRERIARYGFDPVVLDERTKVEPSWMEGFINSTKRAEAVYDQKSVLFKEGHSLADCYHELVHVVQRVRSRGPLSPRSRKQLITQYKLHLNQLVEKVELYEAEGNFGKAKKEGESIQKRIDLLNDFTRFFNDFDEIQAYALVYLNCDRLSCSDEDLDIAASNLFMRKGYLSEEFSARVSQKVEEIMRKKKSSALKAAKKDWIENDLASEAKELLDLSGSDLVKYIKKSGVGIYRIESLSDFSFSFLLKNAIDLSMYKSLDVLPKELAEKSGDKIQNGQAFGKHVCNAGASFIVVNRLASKGTIVHEYLHERQRKKNGSWCDSDQKQNELLSLFQSGKIPRSEYESGVLYLQAKNNLAELEVYRAMDAVKSELNKLEVLNNSEMLEKYEELTDL